MLRLPLASSLAWSLLLVGGLLAGPVRASEVPTVHVAPDGRDTAAGTATAPFATLARARDALRTVAEGQPRRITVHGGSYYDVAVELTAADSGLTIAAAPGEKPILHGGVVLTGWTAEGDHLMAADLPPGRDWQPRLLQVDGQLCARARYPHTGSLNHLTTFDVPWMSSSLGGWKRPPTPAELTTLRYRPEDLGPWLEVRNAEVTVFHMWDDSCVGVAANTGDTLTLAPPCGHPPGAFGVRRYVVWNIAEGLHGPGDWFHDRTRQRIVYWPLPGQDMRSAVAVVPTVTSIIRAAGKPGARIHDVTLQGLELAVTTVPLVAGGFAAEHFPGAIEWRDAERCQVDQVTVSRVAGHGINARGEVRDLRITGSTVAFCGAGGIYVGGQAPVISDNLVHDIGLAFPSAIGIYRGGKGGLVSHNEVHGCSYSGINYGGQDNRIEDNLVYDCMRTLHDGAGIYLFGAKRCTVRGNLVRDIVDHGGYGASAIYLDEQSEGCLVEGNLSLRVGWPSQNHMATGNTLRGNVFIAAGDLQIALARSQGYTLERNVIVAAGKITVKNPGAVATWTDNIVFSQAGAVAWVPLKDYMPTGTPAPAPAGALAEDPLFVDATQGDYRYRPGSPALRLGLTPIDVQHAGRRRP